MNKIVQCLMLALACGILFAACKKEKKDGDRSSWTIKGEVFTSNDAVLENTGGMATLTSHALNKPNSFRMRFAAKSGLPTNGSYDLLREPLTEGQASFDFWYNGTYYVLSKSQSRKLVPKPANGTIQYILEGARFISYLDPSDSLDISGIFVTP